MIFRYSYLDISPKHSFQNKRKSVNFGFYTGFCEAPIQLVTCFYTDMETWKVLQFWKIVQNKQQLQQKQRRIGDSYSVALKT